MNELLEKLNAADYVCQSANEHYIKAEQIEAQAAEVGGKIKKAKRKWIIIGVVLAFVMQQIVGRIFLAIKVPVIQASGVFFILVGYVVVVIFCRKWYLNEKKNLHAEIAKIQRHAQAERDRGQQVFDDNMAIMEFLPSDYWYPVATNYLVKAVQSGRASTLAEALDKFEEQLHRWKIEEANSQMLEMQQQQTAYLSSIKSSSRVSAAANVANAFINMSNKS